MTDVSEQSVAAKWKDLALRAIDCVHDAERETNWGQSTFGPSVWDGLRTEQNDLLHADYQEASGPFVTLTLPASGPIPARPIFINAALVRTANEIWTHKAGHTGLHTQADYDITGTYITVGTGEDSTFSVSESYGEVTGAIRAALLAAPRAGEV